MPTEIVSINPNGNQGSTTSNAYNGDYQSDISGDGRYIVFSTDASGIAVGDLNNTSGDFDVFLRDRSTNTTTLISTSASGSSANGDSYSPAISADGRYIVFYSSASNLIAGGIAYSGKPSVYVYNVQTGITTRIATDTIEAGGNSTNSIKPAISADGRFIAYETGGEIFSDTPRLGKVYLYDQQSGTSSLIGSGRRPSVSADGRFVSFQQDYAAYS
jgi:Tol biopolymer transport system component